MIGKYTPLWGKQILKDMIDLDLTMHELATDLGVSRPYLSNIIHGKIIRPEMQDEICTYISKLNKMHHKQCKIV
ncbi:helix-turn-helix domain-containing protein [Aminipila terrae]|nr:helix-turn-helix domain-containing protein [Aminipila terrae]